jgi:hypothetical protein
MAKKRGEVLQAIIRWAAECPDEIMETDHDIFIAKGGYQLPIDNSIKEIKRVTKNKYIKKVNKW